MSSKIKKCDSCDGVGHAYFFLDHWSECVRCNGSGTNHRRCMECQGSGQDFFGDVCQQCKGSKVDLIYGDL